jgi:1-deoxy-D-xylulose-5-phosphate reductoisomerase
MARLDLARMGELTFAAPDFSEFPCLAYAFEAARMGGTAPAVLNAANETAVQAFCAGRLGFLSISDVVGEVLDRASTNGADDLDAVLAADRRAREEADACIARRGA